MVMHNLISLFHRGDYVSCNLVSLHGNGMKLFHVCRTGTEGEAGWNVGGFEAPNIETIPTFEDGRQRASQQCLGSWSSSLVIRG